MIKPIYTTVILLLTTCSIFAQQDAYFVKVVKECDSRTNCIDIKRDGSQMLIGREDKILELYDLESKKEILEIEAHYQPIIDVQFTKEENAFFSVGDRSIKLWKIGEEKPQKIYTGTHTSITSCDISPLEDVIVASSYNKKYYYWDANELKAIKTPETGHKKNIISVAISNNKKMVATGALDTSIEIWEVDNTKRKHLMLAHSRPISCLRFVKNDKYVLSASHDGNARLWDVATGKPKIMYIGHSLPISSMDVSLDGKYVLMASFDNSVSLFNITTGEKIYNYVYHQAPVLDVVWNSQGDGFYTCDKDGVIVEWAVPAKVFVNFYFGKEIEAQMVEKNLLLPRKKGETKDRYKARLSRADRLRIKLEDAYYPKYIELLKSQAIK